jgi:ABC-type Mn2+/Zn2+ transport system permease subunit
VIADFLEAWPLFRDAWLAGWLLAVVLAMAGILVVARDQVFVGAAVAQASTLGISLGMYLGFQPPSAFADATDGGTTLAWMAVGFGVAASVLMGGRRRPGRESRESMTGWVFLASGSLAILLLSRSPQGLAEVTRVLTSSIIGATGSDVALFAVLAAASVAVAALRGRALILEAVDPVMAEALGLRTRLASFLGSAWVGMVVGLAIRTAGTIFAFGGLVLPVLAARNLCREGRSLYLAAPVLALLSTMAGFVLANHWDQPPAQTAVATMALLVVVTWVFFALRARWGGRPQV